MFSSTEDFPEDWEPTTTYALISKQLQSNATWLTNNLWKIQGIVAYGIEDEILKLVDYTEQILS